VLVILLTMVENIIPFLAWDASVGGLKTLLTERIPRFTIENGVMECEQPMSFKLGDFCTVKEDTGQESYSAEDLKDEAYAFYFSRTNMIIMNSGVTREISYKDFPEGVIDNNTLASMLPVFRISLALSMMFLYATSLIRYLLMSLFYTVLCLGMVKDPGGDRLPFPITFSIAIYARTLFAVIKATGIALGYPMDNVIVELIMVTLTISYIFRGQASVLKIDLKK